MTREEYQHYSDCRQASFTYRKGAQYASFHMSEIDLRYSCVQPSVFATFSIYHHSLI